MAERRMDWYRTALDAGLLRELTERRDLPGLLQAGAFLLVWMATTSVSLYFYLERLWIPMVLACYFHSMFLVFLSNGAAVHELSHGTAFRTKLLNDVFYSLFSFLSWNNPVHFRASHALHHQNTVQRGVDLEVMQGPVKDKLNGWNLLAWFTFNPSLFRSWIGVAVLHALGRSDADYYFWKPLFAQDDPRRRAMIRFARILVLGHLALVLLFAWLQLWVMIYLVTFGVFFAGFLDAFCGALQHTGLSESTPDWRVVCHTVHFGPFMRFLYWNMNYHIEHHMFAAVPFWRLPRLHALVSHDYPVPHRSFLAGIRKLYEIRREQAKDPSYVFVPDFPATAAPVRWKGRP